MTYRQLIVPFICGGLAALACVGLLWLMVQVAWYIAEDAHVNEWFVAFVFFGMVFIMGGLLVARSWKEYCELSHDKYWPRED